MRQIYTFILLFLGLSLKAQTIDHWETLVLADDNWQYTLGNSDPGSSWNTPEFDDTNWQTGSGGFGYGDDDDNTTISTTPSIFIRTHFTINSLDNLSAAVLCMDYDDSFVAYLNGTEIARAGISGTPPTYNQYADDDHEAQMYSGGSPTQFVISETTLQSLMVQGDNLLAIEVHNATATSSDMSAIAYLMAGISDNTSGYRELPSWFSEPLIFTSSNLPIFLIETIDDAEIVDEPKVDAIMKVIDNGTLNTISDDPNEYYGNIGIEYRGNYSASFPQRSYGLETRDAEGENNNVKLLGMPKENDWILLTNYNDKAFMRNAISFNLFQKMGHYAPRYRHCEVMVNDQYKGLYLFTEKIKRDDDRVDIAKLDEDDNAGDSITGGYIFKIDYYTDEDSWTGSYSPVDNSWATVHYVYHYPSADDITTEQKAYIKAYVNTVESVLYGSAYDDLTTGYHKYFDVSSFVDYFIISELSRNVDAYKKSRYFFKEKNNKGGLIHSGPVWDFDWSYKNLNDCYVFQATDGSGWAYKINSQCSVSPSPTGWMVRLMQDEYFQQLLGNRYHELRNTFMSNDAIHAFMDSISDVCNEAQVRHYQTYDILGQNTGAPEVDAIPDSYEGEVEKLRDWIDTRLAWLDANIPEATSTPIQPIAEQINTRIFPNPASDRVYIEADQVIEQMQLISVSGKIVLSKNVNNYETQVNTNALPKGIYLVHLQFNNQSTQQEKLIVQ